jgi:prepilin signal peptidase PulO-like enzyme (type II secretory pathway)
MAVRPTSRPADSVRLTTAVGRVPHVVTRSFVRRYREVRLLLQCRRAFGYDGVLTSAKTGAFVALLVRMLAVEIHCAAGCSSERTANPSEAG